MKRQVAQKRLLELKIERWLLERLIPFAKNSRTHTDAQVAQIAGSISEFGFVNPVLVGPDGVLIAGHLPFGSKAQPARPSRPRLLPLAPAAATLETRKLSEEVAHNRAIRTAKTSQEIRRCPHY